MALRLPGSIMTPFQFWDFLLAKKDARSLVPDTRYNISAYHTGLGKPGEVKSEYGYFLDDSVDIGALDTTFFNMAKTEMDPLDPQQRQLLEVVRECFESAGELNYQGKNIGCFVGTFGEDWAESFAKDQQTYGLYRISRSFSSPSMTIRTGCSSSLIGLHEACGAIARGDCTSAIVGGANMILGPSLTQAMTEQGVLSPDGSCKSFDAEANGYARAEAINAVYVKPLEDALRDGNPIRAVIRGTSSNSDGKTIGISQPSAASHEDMMRKAYSLAGIETLSDTAYIECHGTGTAIGDPIETSAVANVFGEQGVYIGSVKPNVGHSEGASGLTSLIKAVLSLENRTIPPNIKFNKPNPRIAFGARKLRVPVDPVPWPEDRCERAGVNSFGIGGANAHVVLESKDFYLGSAPLVSKAAPQPRILVYLANTPDSLRRQVVNHQQYLKERPECLHDLSYTLGARREHLVHRAYSVAGVSAEPKCSPFTKAPSSAPKLVMVFTGQGAQWPQMGRELFQSNAAFAHSISTTEKYLSTLPDAPSWQISDELCKSSKESNLHKASYSQPLCTAVQVALVDALTVLGVVPAAVVGHSSGEMAAAYAAGRLTAREAIIAAYYRGVVSGQVTRDGGMAAIGLGWDETSEHLVDGVVIACENSPSSVTISGDADRVKEVLSSIQKAHPNALARPLKVDKAYHSHHMKEVGSTYRQLAKGHALGTSTGTKVDFFSSVTGQLLDDAQLLDAAYWQANLESPVLFRTAIANLVAHARLESKDNLMILEVGPHSALAGPLRQILARESAGSSYASCMTRGQDCTTSFLSAMGELYLQNITLDFEALTNPDATAQVLTDTPPYPWQHDRSLLFETRLSKEWRFPKFPKHELLGVRVAESTSTEPAWRNVLILDHVPWIRDHNIKGDVVYPCAAYVAMAGEAVRQLNEEQFGGYSLRNVIVSTAMVHNDTKSMEIMTSLKRHRLTDTLDSAWWEFTISSYNGSAWIKHCSGEVCSQNGEGSGSSFERPRRMSRKVSPAKWYESSRHVGANYGPLFQGLKEISTSTTDNLASSRAVVTTTGRTDVYSVHPTQIDAFLQLLGIAAAKGVNRSFKHLALPTYAEQIDVCSTPADFDITTSAKYNLNGSILGDGYGLGTNGSLALRMKGVKLSPLEGEESLGNNDRHAAGRLNWKPDIDFLDCADLIQPYSGRAEEMLPFFELTALCIEETLDRVSQVPSRLPHLEKFRSWMKAHPKSTGGPSDRVAKIQALVAEVSETAAAPVAEAILKVMENAQAVFNGTTEPLEFLMADQTLTQLYNYMDGGCDRSAFMQASGHSNPKLRILEIGAGTGGTIATILSNLQSRDGGHLMYSNYTYTDISAGFFLAAKDRFKSWPNIEFATLDISQDPEAQGLKTASYDLVLATNVLHATPNLHETLANVRKLIRPDGRLLLQELSAACKCWNFVMGVLPGWWLGAGDGRADEPCVSPQRWEDELREAGFDGLDAVVFDAREPLQINALMMAKPIEAAPISPRDITVLCDHSSQSLAQNLKSELVSAGRHVVVCGLEDTIPDDRDIVALLDLEQPFFANIREAKFDQFRAFVSHLRMMCKDPRFAQSLGAARVIRNEFSLDFATCEIDHPDDSLAPFMAVLSKFQSRREDESFQPEQEYAIVNGEVYVPRFYPFLLKEDPLALGTSEVAAGPVELAVGKYGRLSTMKLVSRPIRPLDDSEVEIETQNVGMNFKDVLIAMGIVPSSVAGFGIEAAGIVRGVGSKVEHVREGDRVFTMGGACFSSSLLVSATLCVKIPDSLSFEDAATMPCVYATVIHSLLDVSRVEKGQSVLIHSACGGVGLAAIQICKMIGAEIYATVGSDNKVEFLIDNYEIPRDHIFHSKDTSFRDDVLRMTEGAGVDVVLNSLSGELLHTSWDCVAEFGTLLEIGKRDFIGNGRLAMNPFELNRNYCGIDLGHLLERKPASVFRLLNKIVKYYEQGYIQPIKPIKTFQASAVEECFRYMQKGQHIGKIVVSMTATSKQEQLLPSESQTDVTFDSDASYLLVGGLGGLGKAVSTWMVERGARHLIYLSRSAGKSAEDQDFIHELQEQDCVATAVQGNAANEDDVAKAVQSATKLKGILQMSMVLRDRQLSRMTFREWNAVVMPKVQGTWNLHNLTIGKKLDFFVMFSSISGIMGQHGQSNYASANTFLDAFVQYRHSKDMAASSMDIGVMEDAGYVAENPAMLEGMRAAGFHTIRESELLDALIMAISAGRSCATEMSDKSYTNNGQFVLGLRSSKPLSDSANRVLWRRDRRAAVYHNESSVEGAMAASTTSNKLREFLALCTVNPEILHDKTNVTFLAQQIGLRLYDMVMKPVEDETTIDISLSVQDLGLDSLVAIEMKTWWKHTFGFDISVLEMLGMGSVLALGEHAAQDCTAL
ncbi:KR domain-containing protein [Exophiala viscosa]|uniref:KR domain-containing protein n=1 Tax=Exophiala viscosa TaxID=2486360 RepID=UPI00218D20B8|nr:KR domain-containing protein [Exophiala viscosa]